MGCLRARNEASKGQSLFGGQRSDNQAFMVPFCMARRALHEALSQAIKLGAMSCVHEFFMSFSTTQSLARVGRHAFALLLGGDHELPQGGLRGRL